MGTRREEWAWAAGFFDGEGNTHLQKSTQNSSLGIIVQVGQSGPDPDVMPQVLRRFAAAVGDDDPRYNISFRGTPKDARMPQWKIRWSGYERVIWVVCQMWPWLGEVKRMQAHSALSEYLVWARTHGRHIKRTHCKNGHELTPENAYQHPSGGVRCRLCRRIDPSTGIRPDGQTR